MGFSWGWLVISPYTSRSYPFHPTGIWVHLVTKMCWSKPWGSSTNGSKSSLLSVGTSVASSLVHIHGWSTYRPPRNNKGLIAGLINGNQWLISPDHKALFLWGGGGRLTSHNTYIAYTSSGCLDRSVPKTNSIGKHSLSQWTLKKKFERLIFPTKYVIPKSLSRLAIGWVKTQIWVKDIAVCHMRSVRWTLRLFFIKFSQSKWWWIQNKDFQQIQVTPPKINMSPEKGQFFFKDTLSSDH